MFSKIYRAFAEAFTNAEEAEPAAAYAKIEEEAESATKIEKVKILKIFLEVCETTNFLQGVRNFRNYGYDAKPGILVAWTSRNKNLPLFLEKIKGKTIEECMAIEISEDVMNLIEEIVLRTIEAACLGLISKSKGSLNMDGALSHIKGDIEVGYYWSVVAHSMAEFTIVCGDKTVYQTFFEQKMLE